MTQAPGQILEIRNIRKRLTDGRELLRGVSLSLRQGEFIGILGPSGAGKSLTIRCTLALTRPSEGEVTLHGRDGWTYSMDRIRGKRLRHARAQIGIIFQGLHLVKRLSVLENVMIGRLGRIHPLRSWLYGFTDREAAEAMTVLERLGLADLAGRVSSTLSGGELQRVAIGRAIFQEPSLFLADEPISSLDPPNAEAIMKMLQTLSRETAVLGAFHQPEMARRHCTRIVGIRQGQVVYDGCAADLNRSALQDIYGGEAESCEQPAVMRMTPGEWGMAS
jgi:phosphonate transport system ATP-binding protein